MKPRSTDLEPANGGPGGGARPIRWLGVLPGKVLRKREPGRQALQMGPWMALQMAGHRTGQFGRWRLGPDQTNLSG